VSALTTFPPSSPALPVSTTTAGERLLLRLSAGVEAAIARRVARRRSTVGRFVAEILDRCDESRRLAVAAGVMGLLPR
jgi:hypothetical protein